MTPREAEALIAQTLEEFLVRRGQGEQPDPADYSDRLGEAYVDFLAVLDVESMLDDLLEPPIEEVLPSEFGPYTLVREIGRGASGIVYEAVHQDLGRTEAVKVLRAGSDADSNAWHRFRQEAKTLARIRHPNIVEIYGAGQVDGRPYFAMALLEGEPLDQVIREDRVPPAKELAMGLAGIADGLQTLHDADVIHRDLKPSNIILRPDGTMVLADFGLARSLSGSAMTLTGQALGTPLFMSPEQILGKKSELGVHTDVYGLGATLYNFVARRPVFPTDDMRVLIRRVLEERPTPLKRVRPEVPADLADIAMKALEKRPEDRYASIGAMRDDLAAFALGRTVRGRPVSRFKRGVRRARRWWIPAAALIVISLAVWAVYARRPGSLTVDTLAEAVVFVDGERAGQGLVELELAPGEYVLRIEHPGFEPFESSLRIQPGENRGHEAIALTPVDAADDVALQALARWTRSSGDRFRRDERLRTAKWAPPAVEVLGPAGRVRIQDLRTYRVLISSAYALDGHLEFRRGGDTLHRSAFDPESMRHEAAIPESVIRSLEPGDVVEWGIVFDHQDPLLATFEVVESDPALEADLARISEGLARAPDLAAFFRGRRLLESDLPLAAYEAARALVVEEGDRYVAESIMPLGLMAEAGRRLGLEATADGARIRTAIRAFPAAESDAWFVEPAPDEAEDD